MKTVYVFLHCTLISLFMFYASHRISLLPTLSRSSLRLRASLPGRFLTNPAATPIMANAEQQNEPPLSAKDFKIYNRAAEQMEYYHGLLRLSWNMLWEASTSGRLPPYMKMRQFITEGLRFAQHLEIHHSIEENHVFPHLAKKMPEFRTGRGRQAAELLRQHRQIHKGLEEFQKYLEECQEGKQELEFDVLRGKMEGWREVLWTHLDQEVKTLGAENMRRYWTKEEMPRIPM
ncbi:hypothetical protein M752DRAFT_338824 [Aspergillus phoenicis ATCC 13157]|nr:hypothetical protein M752DRAFT_338824 [Aspergillus phoenicis ATCC 13157]